MQLLKETIREWQRDQVSVLAAAIAYYAVFALAPMLIIVIAVLTFFGRGDAIVTIMEQIRSVAGQDVAQLVRTMIEHRQAEGGNVLATLVGVGLVLVGATGVVAQLQNALNLIWNVQVDPDRSSVLQVLRVRVKSLLLILSLGLLLLTVIVGTRLLRAVATAASDQVPQFAFLLRVLDPMIAIVVSGLVFAMVFKFLPNVRVAWRPVVVGGLVTAVLFVLANWLLSLYLARGAVAGAYGAAGALVAVLLWVYVSAQILLLGAEFTQVYARRRGDQIVPDERAVWRRP